MPSSVRPGFSVKVGDFEGPFDLLLQLISKHKLEVTELALHLVTDEFIGYIRGQGSEWDLDEASGFLVVAATLLDLKAARLLPSGEVEDEDDLALLEARDLLFARLLQYRAYKEVSALFADRMLHASRRFPRTVGLEPQFAELLPEVLIGIGADQFAALAAKALAPKPIEEVSISHVHVQRVSVREQAGIVIDRLRRQRTATFRSLVADCDSTLLVIGRFLALLELYREQVVAFEQLTPLGDLTIRWTGDDETEVEVTDEFDVEREIDREPDVDADSIDAEVATGVTVESVDETNEGDEA
ncbi:MAG: segregation/condensation protein A [Candidatus Nanopelagicales bacterium]|nr:segregation/condensation protein A [Candidatus Nanopelagicales bacterium]MCF8536922.1 segregation/condensation protein A [Candidatus Nanopelagicales bacterium]MCF8542053.1 segregation/condensation protein A [Candidatus Nanopelagicales bacterium]MCF8556906.1 segregation/condensation protein A [Candidatus Nanopelagicales bacterium]